MKRVLMSLMVIALVGSLLGGTIAYFSDPEKSTGNSFTAGTIDIAVDGENPWTSSYQVSVGGQGADFELKPSQVGWIHFVITNPGSNPVNVWKHIGHVVTTGGAHPESEVREDPDDTINYIDQVIRYDLKVDDVVIIAEDAGYTISPNTSLGTLGIASKWVYLGQIAPGGTMVVEQSYHMDKTTTNWAQGDVMTFDIDLLAQQLGAPAPTPGLP